MTFTQNPFIRASSSIRDLRVLLLLALSRYTRHMKCIYEVLWGLHTNFYRYNPRHIHKWRGKFSISIRMSILFFKKFIKLWLEIYLVSKRQINWEISSNFVVFLENLNCYKIDWPFLLKSRHYKKATKFEKISHLFWQNSCFYSVASKQEGDFFKFFWPSQKNWTLPAKSRASVMLLCDRRGSNHLWRR